MDHFPLVYQKYYDHEAHMTSQGPDSRPFEVAHKAFVDDLDKRGLLNTTARDAIKIVGVWDTVGFHAAGMFEEKVEFRNCELSPRVACAYHALALDERREPFRPTVWVKPSEDSIKLAFGTNPPPFKQDMQQCWFSGRHSDIGGGLDDPRLSDIALGWMIAQCSKEGKLAFTDIDTKDDYLIDSTKTPNPVSQDTPWGTFKGNANEPEWYYRAMRVFYSHDRAPLTYMLEGREQVETTQTNTNEYIHRSVKDRNLNGKGKGTKWESGLVGGDVTKDGAFVLSRDERKHLPVAPKVVRKVVSSDGTEKDLDVEEYFKGRVVKIMGAGFHVEDETVSEVERRLGNTGME
jgi:hypothetical protein